MRDFDPDKCRIVRISETVATYRSSGAINQLRHIHTSFQFCQPILDRRQQIVYFRLGVVAAVVGMVICRCAHFAGGVGGLAGLLGPGVHVRGGQAGGKSADLSRRVGVICRRRPDLFRCHSMGVPLVT